MTKTIATFPNTEFFKELERRVTKLEERVFLNTNGNLNKEYPSNDWKPDLETPDEDHAEEMEKDPRKHPCDDCKFNTPAMDIGCKYRPHCYDWKRWRLGDYEGTRLHQFFCCHCGQLMHETRSTLPQVKFYCPFCGAEC